MPTEDRRLFGPQHWNAIAKDIRTEFAGTTRQFAMAKETGVLLAKSHALTDLALRFAARFKIDNSDFDVLKWLDQCSPDPIMYPFSELWEDYSDRLA